MSDQEEIQKERHQQYLTEEKMLHDSRMGNDIELNRTMRYFSGVILILLTAYVKWDNINCKILIIILSYVPFILSIVSNIIAYMFVRASLNKQSDINWNYYMKGEEQPNPNNTGIIGSILIYISIGSFIVGILLTAALIVFGILELKGGE